MLTFLLPNLGTLAVLLAVAGAMAAAAAKLIRDKKRGACAGCGGCGGAPRGAAKGKNEQFPFISRP